jgi:hypothetical protein
MRALNGYDFLAMVFIGIVLSVYGDAINAPPHRIFLVNFMACVHYWYLASGISKEKS